MTRPPRAPKMADVARAAGVSAMTVSRALRGDAGVNPATRAAILGHAADMGYVLDATAASLKQQRSGFVAVTVPSVNNANFAETVRLLGRGLAQRGLQILLANTEYDLDEEERLIAQLLRRKPEAVVLTGGQHTRGTRAMLAAAGLPVVEIWDRPAAPIGYVVGFSNHDCIAALVDHLVGAGYGRIGFVGGDSARDPRGMDRRAGFIAAMTARGRDATRLVPLGPAPVGMAQGAAALEGLRAGWPDTDAVICVSDLVAFGLLSECQRQGIAVPGDLAIAGFGNYEIGRICVPRLTTLDVHAAEIGARTAALVLDLLAGGDPAPGPVVTLIQPDLILRDSSR